MQKNRLEAFSDGVIAIIITIMVLELKIPHDPSMQALINLFPVFISYLFSFVFVGIYWGNHHHLMHTLHHVNSKVIWANMGFLFVLSLIPFTTGWMGENHFQELPMALYGVNLLLCAIAYYFLHLAISSNYTHSSKLIEALKKQEKKGMFSLAGYAISIPLAFVHPIIPAIIWIALAVAWVIPDRNIEKAMKD